MNIFSNEKLYLNINELYINLYTKKLKVILEIIVRISGFIIRVRAEVYLVRVKFRVDFNRSFVSETGATRQPRQLATCRSLHQVWLGYYTK